MRPQPRKAEPPLPPLAMPAYPDPFLREYGFAITARPPGGPPLWQDQRTHVVMAESEAYDRALTRAAARRQERQRNESVP